MEKEKSKEKKCAIFFVDDDIDDCEFFREHWKMSVAIYK